MVPQAVPLHPDPVTPLVTDQVTAVLLVPVTVAVNCNWLGAEPDGGRNALAGETTTSDDAPPVPTILICALALRDASALLVAVSSTGFCEGTVLGAR